MADTHMADNPEYEYIVGDRVRTPFGLCSVKEVKSAEGGQYIVMPVEWEEEAPISGMLRPIIYTRGTSLLATSTVLEYSTSTVYRAETRETHDR